MLPFTVASMGVMGPHKGDGDRRGRQGVDQGSQRFGRGDNTRVQATDGMQRTSIGGTSDTREYKLA